MRGYRVSKVVAPEPTQRNVVIELVPREGYGARDRVDQAGRETERRFVKADVTFSESVFDEAVERDAEVEDEGRRESRQMVGHKGIVDALEWLLAILPGS